VEEVLVMQYWMSYVCVCMFNALIFVSIHNVYLHFDSMCP